MVAGASLFFEKSRPSLPIIIIFNIILGKYCSFIISIDSCMLSDDDDIHININHSNYQSISSARKFFLLQPGLGSMGAMGMV